MYKFETDYNYKPCRIIYYNSGRYTFFETNLDKNTILFGGNNAGKTSFLNGLQFFLLPEINLNRLHDKFHFDNKYTKKETYEYYFPSKESFIIAEFENAFGKFLQIIFRGNDDYEYHRIFTKAKYEDIKQNLWDSENNEIKEINATDFKDYLKTTDNYKYLRSIDSIIEVIYSNDINNEDRGRYAIVPINSKYENIRNIIKLAFNIDVIEDQELKHIFLNYIESNLKTKKDVIDFDFNKFCNKQLEYKADINHYSIIKNNLGIYNRCEKNITTLKDLGPRIKKNHIDFFLLNDNIVKNNNNDMQVILDDLTDLEEMHRESKEQYQKVEKELVSKTTTLEFLNKNLVQKETKYKNYIGVIQNFKLEGKSDVECLLYFDTLIKNIELDLNIIEDKSKIEAEISKITSKIKKLQIDIDERSAIVLDSQDSSIVYNQLSKEDSILLRTILPKLSNAKYTLNEKEKNVISSFKDLVNYNSTNETYYLFNKKLDKFEEKLDIELEKEIIESNKKSIEDLIKDRENKKNLLSEDISKNKEKLLLDKDRYNEFYLIVKNYNCVSEIEEMKAELSELQIKIKEITLLRDSTKTIATNNSNAFLTKDNLLKQLKKEQEEHNTLYQKVKISTESLGLSVEIKENDVMNPNIKYLTSELVDSFCKDLSDSTKAKKEIHNDLLKFVEVGIIEDDERLIIQSEMKARDMQLIFTGKLVGIYENIDEKMQSVDLAMRSGFNEAYEAAINISEYKKHVTESINQFNKDLSGIGVSNFKHISLEPNFNLRFADFNTYFNKFDNHNPTNETIDAFFTKMRQLLQEIGLIQKITLDKVINNFTIRYHNEDNSFETKGQSNGTSIMANAVILSQLKNELVKGGKHSKFNYQLPIIIDEVANIDNNNLKVLKKFLNDKDLVMFCATPTPSINADNNYESVIYLSSTLNHKIFSDKRPVVHCLPEEVSIKKINSLEESFGEYKEGE